MHQVENNEFVLVGPRSRPLLPPQGHIYPNALKSWKLTVAARLTSTRTGKA